MRVVIIVFLTVLLCLCTACGEKEVENKKSQATPAPTESAVSSAGVTAESDLASKSKEFAEQIVAGLFAPVWECFSVELANQMPEESLKNSWNSVVATVSGYEGIHDVEETKKDGNSVVLVTLRYKENKGRSIKFVYDENERIIGIWFQEETLKTPEGENLVGDWEEKEITIGRSPYILEGRLTVPSEREKKVPLVILLSDSSEHDMDGTLGTAKNKPLRDLAIGLAKQKIATVRYHRRAYQYAAEVSSEAGVYETLVQDVWYAIDQMYNETQIDRQQIYLLAYGKAANYLPSIVKKKAGRLAGAIMIGAKPMYAAEVYYGEESIGIISDAKYFMEENSTLPLLVLHGEEDFETPLLHYEQWKEIWKGRSHVAYHSYKKLNHYLMMCKGYTTQMEYDGENKVSELPIQDIAEWCKEEK